MDNITKRMPAVTAHCRIFTPARQPTSLVARAQEPGSEYLANMGIYVFKREALFRCAKAKPESSTR